jgi:hypothetical protein
MGKEAGPQGKSPAAAARMKRARFRGPERKAGTAAGRRSAAACCLDPALR